jgi:hypothetical protein
MIMLVRLGVAARFAFCMVKLIGADEDAARYKKRALNAVLFGVIAESAWVIKDLVMYYYFN